MAEENFSWLSETTLEPIKVEAKEDKKQMLLNELKQKFFYHKRAFVILFSLIILLIFLKFNQKESPAPERMEAMAAVMPIAKGEIIEGMLIRPIRIHPSSLTKAQRPIRVLQEDAEKIMGKVRAKKDIPPHKPLLWSDLELIPMSRNPIKSIIPVISYPEN